MKINPLRSIANLLRAWRLLKIISAAQKTGEGTEADLEALLERSSREAFGIRELLLSIRREQFRWTGELSTHLERSRNLQESISVESSKRSMETAEVGARVASATESMQAHLKETQQVLQSLRDYSLEQQKEIRRLREGYDYTIIKTFILRIVHALDEAQGKIERVKAKSVSEGQIDDLEFIHDLFLFALEGSGVERFVPELGTKFDAADQQLEPTGTAPTEDQLLHMTISKVLKPGYRIQLSEEKHQVVRPAQIEYSKFQNLSSA